MGCCRFQLARAGNAQLPTTQPAACDQSAVARRRVGGWLASGLVLFAMIELFLAGCDVDAGLTRGPDPGKPAGDARSARESRVERDYPVAADAESQVRDADSPTRPIRIASFNIQVFGTNKLKQPEVAEVLVDVVRRFDVIAIQELRSREDSVVPEFLALVNQTRRRYESIVGPRLGRTTSKEQYVYLYDSARIELVAGSAYSLSDPQDNLHREPLVAQFRTRNGFSFTLVNIHTDPDEVKLELDVLDDVLLAVQRDGSGEDDVILLGDLNADYRRLGELGQLPGLAWAISGEPTNTRRSKSYDNILFDRRTTNEFTGQAGVLDLLDEFGLSEEEALRVSDHMPVWAEFSSFENGVPVVASRPERAD